MTEQQIDSHSIKEKIASIKGLCNALKHAQSAYDKLYLLNDMPGVNNFLGKSPSLRLFLTDLAPESEIALKSILAIGQGDVVFNQIETVKNKFDALSHLLQSLLEVEKFYEGGIAGYYCKVLELIAEKDSSQSTIKEQIYHKPQGIDITEATREVQQSIRWGIDHLPHIAELYPVGGAGDRLNWRDSRNRSLSAATLPFGGISLLEWLIRDLQAKEFLYWKLHGKQLVTPLAMMTSQEKDNHAHILSICQEHGWFGRPYNSFKFFAQPVTPVITELGDFSLSAPLQLTLKPGGHGVIWKLAADNGIFDWMTAQGKAKLLLRQINNPMAGTDYGVLSFMGIGCQNEKAFGFASCPRKLNTAEGMVVLVESPQQPGNDYCITNIEYTLFQSKGIADQPKEQGSEYSAFPTNTNILYADIKAIQNAIQHCPIPGMLINMKSKAPFIDSNGVVHQVYAGRLESTMQNIADVIVDHFPRPLKPEEQQQLRSYVTYNQRRKTISVTKKQWSEGSSALETPESCFYDMLANHHELFSRDCRMTLPALNDLENYLHLGPSFIIRYHPALGPLYSIISQKIRGGKMAPGSELILNIAELDIEGLDLNGALHIRANDILGHTEESEEIIYSNHNGKCELKDVRVINRGINKDNSKCFWKNEIERHEAVEIILHGNAEFFAEGVTLEGGMQLEVLSGHRMTVQMHEDLVLYKVSKIASPTWHWSYSYAEDDAIIIKKS